jgi:predicted nucleic acid-binding protein
MFTIDASVHFNALNPREIGSAESQAFIGRVFTRPWTVYSPTILFVEFATSTARFYGDDKRALIFARALRSLPGQIWIPLDDALADIAAAIGAEYRLRGADAVYAAVAYRNKTTLVTLDQQQLTHLAQVIPVCHPAKALSLLA